MRWISLLTKAKGPYDDPDNLEKDHFATFVDLQKGKATWDVYNVRSNPHTVGYWNEDRRIYHGLFGLIHAKHTDHIHVGFAHI